MTIDLFADGRWLTAAGLAEIGNKHRQTLARHPTVLVMSSSPPALAIALSVCRELGTELVIAPSARTFQDVEPHLARWGVSLVVRGLSGDTLDLLETPAADRNDRKAGVVIFTSGSTGAPKLVQHAWDTISASERFVPERLRRTTWFLAYEPGSYAGLQVWFSANAAMGRLVVPDRARGTDQARLIAETGVQVVSGTPTWWRLLVNGWPAGAARPPLLQATLGGERVSQDVIDLVDAFFAPESLTHIYASSEAGTAIVVSDRKEGFPAKLLDENGRVGLRVRDGVLQVRSERAMRGYVDGAALENQSDGWLGTKDRIEIRGERCYFVGREDGLINVGGMKVMPEEVEARLAKLPGVRDCVVYGRQNPVTGVLLAADVVAEGVTAAEIRSALTSELPAYKVPQHIRFVETLAVSDHGKKARR